MKAAEFARFAATMKTIYSKEKILETPEAMELWLDLLSDIEYPTAMAALKTWVATNKWSPSIAEIRAMCVETSVGKMPDWGESWEKMRKAISKWGYMREDKALEEMDPVTREVVQRLGFQSICLSEDEQVLRGQFRRIHEDVSRRMMEDAQIPEALKRLAAAEPLKLEGER